MRTSDVTSPTGVDFIAPTYIRSKKNVEVLIFGLPARGGGAPALVAPLGQLNVSAALWFTE